MKYWRKTKRIKWFRIGYFTRVFRSGCQILNIKFSVSKTEYQRLNMVDLVLREHYQAKHSQRKYNKICFETFRLRFGNRMQNEILRKRQQSTANNGNGRKSTNTSVCVCAMAFHFRARATADNIFNTFFLNWIAFVVRFYEVWSSFRL